jgi:folylpolyglutamate synthase/dihydropteroate synthase
VERALEAARAVAGPQDAIVVTGSFYVAGEALARLGKEA